MTEKDKYILVTGAAGRIGGQIAQQLAEKGHRVLGTDRFPLRADAKASFEFAQADLLDGPLVEKLVSGSNAIVHVAANPGPSKYTPPGVAQDWAAKSPIGLEDVTAKDLLFQNLESSYNVFESAVKHGVRRVVFSSSAFAMGWSHDPSGYVPQYLPLDENHPPLPHETYGLSKFLGEGIAEMLARAQRTETKTAFVSLRFTNIIKRERWAELPWEPPVGATKQTLVLWAYTHEDDVLDAHLKALEAENINGHTAVLLAAPTTRFKENTMDLLAQQYPPEVLSKIEFKRKLTGNDGLIDCTKAKTVLGWSARRWS
ncbi:NAD(P)-binding protein [Gonapodya prolifera JEL478]|uniref:NAD(P)-binding protein n=1 Tax=Gonapodya prolifera (strain JEL478) TaxID=1344416 RepID=A0A139A8J6_GONPJ|nr:NAD(P)-binding protein [Gonapodya prolifera JEL478]|eukprot:KXS12775.1 NAD(P)-binding protein [Gonapodya prolifera JEL478]